MEPLKSCKPDEWAYNEISEIAILYLAIKPFGLYSHNVYKLIYKTGKISVEHRFTTHASRLQECHCHFL